MAAAILCEFNQRDIGDNLISDLVDEQSCWLRNTLRCFVLFRSSAFECKAVILPEDLAFSALCIHDPGTPCTRDTDDLFASFA